MAPSNGDNKHGRAIADREREKRLRLQAETQRAMRAFRDSSAELPEFEFADNERTTSPNIIIQNHYPPPSKPSRFSTWHPMVVKAKVTKWVVAGLAVAGGIIAALKQAGIIK